MIQTFQERATHDRMELWWSILIFLLDLETGSVSSQVFCVENLTLLDPGGDQSAKFAPVWTTILKVLAIFVHRTLIEHALCRKD